MTTSRLPFVLLLISLLTGISCSRQGESKIASPTAMASFSIEGMMCEVGCAAKINETLAGLPGVVQAEVAFSEKTARISFDESQISAADLVSTVEKLNKDQYKVSDLVVTPVGRNTSGDVKSEKQAGKGNTAESGNVTFRPIVFPDIFQNLRKIF